MLRVGLRDALRQRAVALGQRIDGVGDLLLGEPAHFRDHAREVLQIAVEGFGRVLSVIVFILQSPGLDAHDALAETAGDVVLGAAIVRRREHV